MEFFKRATIGISMGLALSVLVVLGILRLNEQTQNKILTIADERMISMEGRKTAYQPMLIAPYKTMDIFLSTEENPGFKFTSVGGTWEEVVPSGSSIEAEVRLKVDGKWTEWLALEEEDDMIQDNKSRSDSVRKVAMASSNPATAMQYRFIMYGDGVSTPMALNPEWTFIKTAEKANLSAAPSPAFASTTATSNATYAAFTSANSTSSVITRKQWGADESYRYLVDNNEDPELIKLNAELYEKYKDELVITRTVEKDSSGKKYSWPLQYPEKVKKFVIHHTATTSNLNDPKQAIRDIYYYHSITRAWGDIGYNYIIDRDGIVYEGRYGGEGVIGAHAGLGNNGSIGIAVLGNYENTEVPEKVVGSLAVLVGSKAKLHGIDPAGYSNFRGSAMPNIFGHKDIMSTTCPGIYLYEKLPVIRTLAKESGAAPEKEKFVKEYDYIDHSELFYVELSPRESKEITFKIENIGKTDWNNKTYLIVDKNAKFDGVVSFPGSDSLVTAKMQENLVKPGQTATFKLKVQGGTKTETVQLKASPMINGSIKGKEYIVVPIATTQADFRYKLVSSHFPPATMKQGEQFKAWVKLENTGNVTWKKTGTNTVLLGTDHERDRVSKLISPTPSTRIGYLQEASVAPGEIGTFNINIKAPQQAGNYKEYFTPVVEGVTWMADSGMYFETTVYGDKYDAELVEASANKEWKQGKSYLIRVRIRNLGQVDWTKNNLDVVLIKENDLKVSDVQLLSEPVKPGQVGTISMVTQVASDEKIERKALLLKPTVDKVQILNRPVYVYYKVIKGDGTAGVASSTPKTQTPSTTTSTPTTTASTSDKSPDIRVKLGFSGNPEISANTTISVYSGQSLIGTLASGKTATVSRESNQYKVNIDGKAYSKSDPIRFVSGGSGILKINNFENRPAWNTNLNDNQYRDILEVREVDSKLVVINELSLEDYLKGLGEVSNSETPEKIRAIIVAARTYAKYYMDVDEKFPGKPYHLDDNPDVSQKYLGYGLEKRSPNVSAAVIATQGEVVTYKGKLVKTPYFNQSDGKSTKSAESVWGWKDTPYLVSVSDTYCKSSGGFLGHGVGLSGCGAKGMAEAGKTYKEILKYFYSGVEITDLY